MSLPDLAWRKSSFSSPEGDCVEMAWRKSSFSGPETDCVEVAWPVAGAALRDSKNVAGPMLLVPERAVTALVATLSKTE